jgi:hypothetical protein
MRTNRNILATFTNDLTACLDELTISEFSDAAEESHGVV